MKPQRSQRSPLRSPKGFLFKEITERTTSCALEVHSMSGPGLLESVYEEASINEFAISFGSLKNNKSSVGSVVII